MQKLKLTKKYEKYPEYKDSGVEWIGKIPKEWSTLKGKFVFRNKKEINVGMKNDNVLSLTMNGVINRDSSNNEGLLPSDYQTFQIFEKDDLVFKLIDLENYKTSRVGIVHEKGIMSPVYIRLESIKGQIPKYFYYLYYAFYIEGVYNFLGSGVRSALGPKDLLEMNVSIPDSKTQNNIARYLDKKIADINLIIEKKQKMIELLKEKRVAVIDHAVTRGIDPKVELVESGMDWIGKIPKGWKLDKVKRVAGVLPSNIDKLSVKDELPVRLCNYTDVYKNRSIVSGMIENLMIATATENQIRKLSLQKDDVIITKDSETPDDIGIPAYVPETLTGVVCGYHLAIIRPYKICGAYLNYFFLSKMAKTQFFMAANGLTRYALGIGDIGMTVVPLPSKNEQEKIACYLDEKIDTFDNAIHLAEKSIQILQEFKASLISSVVTGKIKIN
jgi:type I restriction enzyme S subunit